VLAATAFLLAAAYWCVKNMPLDALPDLSDTQVIIYSKWDRSPDTVEDQVTYPIVSSLLGLPGVKAVRGFSDFGYSYVYLIFKDGTDIYWARARTLEYLSKILPQLPQGVKPELGPDATGLGWIYQYALVDKTGRNSLAQLRSYQDWYLRYYLQSVPGVAEVASVGGFQKQYQININPDALAAYKIPLLKVLDAVRDGNGDSGGGVVEMSGAEYMVRGHGYAKSVQDIENIAVTSTQNGTPVLIRQLSTVETGPAQRRGVADLDGNGDTVGGIIVARQGENALNVINRVKARIAELKPTLPPGVEIVPVYDRSGLILRALETLKSQLSEEMLIVSLVILVFLWHIPSAIVPIVTIPAAVFISFILFYFTGLTANIMSLSGIAISIGVLVDGAIVEVENAYKKLEEWRHGDRKEDFHAVRLRALQEVGPSVFFSLLVIAAAFLPVFTLVDQEGRLFRPLAYTKTLAMAAAALLAISLDPALRMMFTRVEEFSFKPKLLCSFMNAVLVGKYYPEEKHPISRRLFKIYGPVCAWTLANPWKVISGAVLLVALTVPVYLHLGSEYMPPLNEGTVLYMPTTLPGISVAQAQDLLERQDAVLKSFPEVERVFGKAGRADTATDPAPLSMMETVVELKPQDEWPQKKRWYSAMPELPQKPLRHIWPDRISPDELTAEMDAKMQFPGVTNAWTMPIKARMDMLSTGMRTPVGIKIYGSDPAQIEKLGADVEAALKTVPGTRSAYAERAAGGYFMDFDFRREALARYGISVREAEEVVASAIGGEPVSAAIEGRERYGIAVRYARDFRNDADALGRVLIQSQSGAQVPLAQVADISLRKGPGMIRDENGRIAGYVYADIAGRDVGGYVNDAKTAVARAVSLPPGYALEWSGQYENMLRVRERLKIVLPLTLFIIFALLYMNTSSAAKALIVMLAVPFSLVGAVWFLWMLGYNISIAVWVGMIALMGLDAETGVFMLMFMDMSCTDYARQGRMNGSTDLREAIMHGAVRRLRPKLMTVCAAFMGLVPIMWSLGSGADMMKRIAAPMIGGLLTSFALELLVYPPVYYLLKLKTMKEER
jgi:Cu(I)/Ag(I) efflux system membrane protein CusA/SilA